MVRQCYLQTLHVFTKQMLQAFNLYSILQVCIVLSSIKLMYTTGSVKIVYCKYRFYMYSCNTLYTVNTTCLLARQFYPLLHIYMCNVRYCTPQGVFSIILWTHESSFLHSCSILLHCPKTSVVSRMQPESTVNNHPTLGLISIHTRQFTQHTKLFMPS